MSQRKDLQKRIQELRDDGWQAELSRRGHWRLRGPDGQLVFTGSTPSDHRTLKNLEASIRRETERCRSTSSG